MTKMSLKKQLEMRLTYLRKVVEQIKQHLKKAKDKQHELVSKGKNSKPPDFNTVYAYVFHGTYPSGRRDKNEY